MFNSDRKVLFLDESVGSIFVEINTNSAQLELRVWLSLATFNLETPFNETFLQSSVKAQAQASSDQQLAQLC